MALKNPPIQDVTLEEDGRFRDTWIKWFRSVTKESKEGFTGSFNNADGDTVTVVNGKITDVS